MTVMKIYRRSIKKSTSMYTLKPIVVILALFLLMTIGNLKGFLVFLVHYCPKKLPHRFS